MQMKNTRMNIPHFRFTLFNLKFFGGIVSIPVIFVLTIQLFKFKIMEELELFLLQVYYVLTYSAFSTFLFFAGRLISTVFIVFQVIASFLFRVILFLCRNNARCVSLPNRRSYYSYGIWSAGGRCLLRVPHSLCFWTC